MGWKDAPEVDRRRVARTPAWASAPEETAPAEVPEEGAFDQFVGGIKHSGKKAYRGVKGLVGGDTSELDKEAAEYEAKPKSGWATAGEIAGDIGIMAPLALVPGGLGVQMALGAGANAAFTPGSAEERAKSAAFGAGGAAVGNVLTKALSRVARPIGDKAADTLALEARGVEPTFGQSMAQKGTALGRQVGRAEEAMQSVPLASGPLVRSRERAMDQWRTATRQEARPPGAAGRTPEDLPGLRGEWNQHYRSVLNSEPMPYSAVQYQPDMRTLSQGMPVTPAERDMAERVFQEIRLKHMSNPTPGVQVTAGGAHGAESDLKAMAVQMMNTPGKEDAGRLLLSVARDYAQAWRGGLQNPNTRNAIDALDRAYPGYKAVQKAGQKVGAVASEGDPSRYTPTALLNASKQVDRSVGKKLYERTNAPMQELGQLGLGLTNKLPESGTTPRALMSTMAIGGAGAIEPSTLLSLAALYGYGSRPVQQYLTGRAAPEVQRAIMEWLRRAVPLGAQAGAASAQELGAKHAP